MPLVSQIGGQSRRVLYCMTFSRTNHLVRTWIDWYSFNFGNFNVFFVRCNSSCSYALGQHPPGTALQYP
uniref:Uncharacterized protein n=1 Tax=Pararge aegeria TaxID=116150 RepID=S4NYX4_9NEOP